MRVKPQDWLFDTLLAVLLLAIGVVGTGAAGLRQPGSTPVGGFAYGLVVTAALALVVRRLWPVVALAVVTVAASTYLVLGYPYGPILLTVVVAVYTVALRLPWWHCCRTSSSDPST